MVRLNREQEWFLRELVRIDRSYARRSGLDRHGRPVPSVEDHIRGLLDESSFFAMRPDGACLHETCREYDRVDGLCSDLAERGMLGFSNMPRSGRRYTGLTSSGRCYFSEKRREFWSRWGPTFASSVFGLAGVALGWALAKMF